MSKFITAEDVRLEVAKTLNFPTEGLKSIEIIIEANELVRVVADYHANDEDFSRFMHLIKRFEAKEDEQ